MSLATADQFIPRNERRYPMLASKKLTSVMVDSHPLPLAKNGKIRALSIRASLAGDASAARLNDGNTNNTPTHAERVRSFLLSMVGGRWTRPVCFRIMTSHPEPQATAWRADLRSLFHKRKDPSAIEAPPDHNGSEWPPRKQSGRDL